MDSNNRNPRVYSGSINNQDIPHGVTVEICSACNRRCTWCPQSKFPRTMQYLPMELIEKIATELAQVGYEGGFGLHLFNEPLLDSRITTIIEKVHAILPKGGIYIHTNGDALTMDKWLEIRKAGLHWAQINQYDGCISDKISAFRDGLSEDERQHIKIRRFSSRRHVCNRAGLIKTRYAVPMESRCKRIWQACINYAGDMVLCCNDYNGQVVVGNVANANIIDLFNDPKLVHYRRLLRKGRRAELKLCDVCDL